MRHLTAVVVLLVIAVALYFGMQRGVTPSKTEPQLAEQFVAAFNAKKTEHIRELFFFDGNGITRDDVRKLAKVIRGQYGRTLTTFKVIPGGNDKGKTELTINGNRYAYALPIESRIEFAFAADGKKPATWTFQVGMKDGAYRLNAMRKVEKGGSPEDKKSGKKK